MTAYSIVLPVYNEAENLPILVFLLSEVAQQHGLTLQLVVVEDNSPDGTRAVAKKLVGMFGRVQLVLVERESKLGLGTAYRAGLQHCTADFVWLMDADLSHHPKYLPLMIECTPPYVEVSGTRYKAGGGVEGWNFYRKLTSRTANFLTKFLLGAESSDFTGSFRLYRRCVLERLMGETKTKGYSFQMEILVRAQRAGLKVEELPIVFVDRLFGHSKLAPNEIFLYLNGLLRLFFEA